MYIWILVRKTALRYMLYFTFVHNGVSIRKIIITT